MCRPSPRGCYLCQGGDLDQGILPKLLRSLGGTPPACFPRTLPATAGWWLKAQPQTMPLWTGHCHSVLCLALSPVLSRKWAPTLGCIERTLSFYFAINLFLPFPPPLSPLFSFPSSPLLILVLGIELTTLYMPGRLPAMEPHS